MGSVHTVDTVPVPRTARFPIELTRPEGFVPDDPATWPAVDGRLEFVGGRLLYMPPCGDVQQDVTGSVAVALGSWVEERDGYVFATNEAGMLLGGDVRGADAAIWRRDTLGGYTGGYRQVPPLLAVEVAGQLDSEELLRAKASWYLDRGVSVVWLVLPASREVVVLEPGRESRVGQGERVPEHPDLPGLAPDVDRLFRQLD